MTFLPTSALPGILVKRKTPLGRSISKLRSFAVRPVTARDERTEPMREAEVCELCSAPLAHEHRHLLELKERRVACACDACAMRFVDVVGGRFKAIPRDAHELPDFHFDDALWAGFALPINLVFFFYSTTAQRVVALYPSPAGATESLLSLEMWEQLVERNPVLAAMEPDVEALLVNRAGDPPQYFLAPMDRCYALVGLLRVHWRGLSGGEVVWGKIAGFFEELRAQSRPLHREVAHA